MAGEWRARFGGNGGSGGRTGAATRVALLMLASDSVAKLVFEDEAETSSLVQSWLPCWVLEPRDSPSERFGSLGDSPHRTAAVLKTAAPSEAWEPEARLKPRLRGRKGVLEPLGGRTSSAWEG